MIDALPRRALDLYRDGVRRYQADLVMAHHDLAELAVATKNPVVRRLAHWRLRNLGRKVRITMAELAEGESDSYGLAAKRLGG